MIPKLMKVLNKASILKFSPSPLQIHWCKTSSQHALDDETASPITLLTDMEPVGSDLLSERSNGGPLSSQPVRSQFPSQDIEDADSEPQTNDGNTDFHPPIVGSAEAQSRAQISREAQPIIEENGVSFISALDFEPGRHAIPTITEVLAVDDDSLPIRIDASLEDVTSAEGLSLQYPDAVADCKSLPVEHTTVFRECIASSHR